MTVLEGVVLINPSAINYSPQALLPMSPCSDPPIVASVFNFGAQALCVVFPQTPPMVDFVSGFLRGSQTGQVAAVTGFSDGYTLGRTLADDDNENSVAGFSEGFALRTTSVTTSPTTTTDTGFSAGYGFGTTIADEEFQSGYDEGIAATSVVTQSVTNTYTVEQVVFRNVVDDDEFQNGYNEGVDSSTVLITQQVTSPTSSTVYIFRNSVDDDEFQTGYDEGSASSTVFITQPVIPPPAPISSPVYIVNTIDDEDYQNGYDDGIAAAVFASAQPFVPTPTPQPVLNRRSSQRENIMATPRFKWPIPTRNIDNWYDPFVNLQTSVDTSTFANTEDRNAICMGGGTFEFTQLSGLLTWDGTIEILSANTGFVRAVVPGSILLSEGELFLVELPRYPTDNAVMPALKATNLSILSNINDTFVLAVRRNNIVYFRNGKNLQDGDSFEVFSTTGAGGIAGFTVKEEGTPLGSFTALNFVGQGITAANAGSGQSNISLNPFSTTLQGIVTPSGSAANVLRGDNTWATIAQLGLNLGQFGDGSDGNAVMDGIATVAGMVPVSGVYTAIREYFFRNLTVNVGKVFKPAGFPQCVRGILTNNGRIDSNGGDGQGGGAFGNPVGGGAAAYTGATVLPFTGTGVSGAAGQGSGFNGLNVNTSPQLFNNLGGNGGAIPLSGSPGINGTAGGTGKGGGGGSTGSSVFTGRGGGAGGTVAVATAQFGDVRSFICATTGHNLNGGSLMSTGSSGGSGAGSMSNPALGGAGGGSGAPGGWVVIKAVAFAGTGTGTYEAKGGAGGAGTLGNSGLPEGAAGGGGGPGGVFVILTADPNPPTPIVTGGLGGAGLAGGGGSGALSGGNGGDGGPGIVILLN